MMTEAEKYRGGKMAARAISKEELGTAVKEYAARSKGIRIHLLRKVDTRYTSVSGVHIGRV